MVSMTESPLFASPRYPGEYRVVPGDLDMVKVYHGAMNNRSYGWVLSPLYDSLANTATTAYKLSVSHQKQGFECGKLIPEQFNHYVTNLAVKLHQVMPFEARSFVAEKALHTIIRMAQSTDKACWQMLVDARLEQHHPHAAAHQHLLRNVFQITCSVPAAFVRALACPSVETYPQRIADALAQIPVVVPQLDRLCPKITFLLREALINDPHPSAERQFLLEWLDSAHPEQPHKTHFEHLTFDTLAPAELMTEFTVSLMAVKLPKDQQDGCAVHATSRLITADQGTIANHVLTGKIDHGRWEHFDGKVLPVFRSSFVVPCSQSYRDTLNGFVLQTVNGQVPDASVVSMFCDLFLLTFDYAPSSLVIDGEIQ